MLAGQLLILISQGGGDEETEPPTSNSPILTHLTQAHHGASHPWISQL
jgi:hypothetical protein